MIPEERPKSGLDLPRIADKTSFLYAEHCRVDRDDQTVVLVDDRGRTAVPIATIGALLLGPGTRVSHRAMTTVSDHGCTVVWIGEQGVRFYASGHAQNRSSRLAETQAASWANPRSRNRVARLLYLARFPGEDVGRLSIAQLRGREGARVREAYKAAARSTGVAWTGRQYDPNDWNASDPVNQALSAATACLYGVCHAAVCVLGLVPSLGFVHVGHRLSFVYDVADLYKAEVAIPAAFRAVAGGGGNLERAVRHNLRDHFARTHFMERIAKNLLDLFSPDLNEEGILIRLHDGRDVLRLWDPEEGEIPSGVNYADLVDEGWS